MSEMFLGFYIIIMFPGVLLTIVVATTSFISETRLSDNKRIRDRYNGIFIIFCLIDLVIAITLLNWFFSLRYFLPMMCLAVSGIVLFENQMIIWKYRRWKRLNSVGLSLYWSFLIGVLVSYFFMR